jgi:hypothetical protein
MVEIRKGLVRQANPALSLYPWESQYSPLATRVV